MSMCRAIEEMWNQAAEQATFKTRLNDILMVMKKLGWTKEQALEFYEIPKTEYPKYLPLLVV